MMLTKEAFRKMKSWLKTTAIDDSADSITVHGMDITFICVTGNIWINPNTTATSSNGFPLLPGESIDLCVADNLSIISDGSGGTYKYIIWDPA